MAKKTASVEIRVKVTTSFGSSKMGIFQAGDIVTQKDLPKPLQVAELLKAGFVEEYKGDLVGLSEKAMADEIKALKEENEALKAMG